MALTSKLGLELLANSASNYLLANKTFFQLSQAVQLTVVSRTLSTPPGSPTTGDAYIVAAAPTGAWTGKAGQIAYWETSIAAWAFIVPANGWVAFSTADLLEYKYNGTAWVPLFVAIGVACSDEETPIAAGTNKVTFRMPYAFLLKSVRASLTTAQTSGALVTVDVNANGTSRLSTKLTIDNTEKTSLTAATAHVVTSPDIPDDAEITIDIDNAGDGTATGLKVWLIGAIA